MFTLKPTHIHPRLGQFFEVWNEVFDKGTGTGAYDKDSARFILRRYLNEKHDIMRAKMKEMYLASEAANA